MRYSTNFTIHGLNLSTINTIIAKNLVLARGKLSLFTYLLFLCVVFTVPNSLGFYFIILQILVREIANKMLR